MWLAALVAQVFLIAVVTYGAASVSPGPNWENGRIALTLWCLDFALVAALVGWLLGHPLVIQLVDIVAIVGSLVFLPGTLLIGGHGDAAILLAIIVAGVFVVIFARRAFQLPAEPLSRAK